MGVELARERGGGGGSVWKPEGIKGKEKGEETSNIFPNQTRVTVEVAREGRLQGTHTHTGPGKD